MAAHRAARGEADPLRLAQELIEKRLRSGDADVWRWLTGLTGAQAVTVTADASEPLTFEAAGDQHEPLEQFDYETGITDPDDRDWAESAEGFVTFGLGQSMVKMLEAGNLLSEAQQRLPRDQFIAWVRLACRLKPEHAARLIQGAERQSCGSEARWRGPH